MGARGGGETDQQNFIMHKAYLPNFSSLEASAFSKC